jgi:hypothetical protein
MASVGASTATGASKGVQEKASKMLQQLSNSVDQLQGVSDTSQHGCVHLAHLQKDIALQEYENSKTDSELPFKMKVVSATSAFLHAKLQDPALVIQTCAKGLGKFEQFNPDAIDSVVVKECFKNGQFKYISSPVRAFEVMNSEEKELHMESIQADLHGKHPVQLHTCLTFNEFKEFSKDGCLPTARGE